MPIIYASPTVVANYESNEAINQSSLKDIMFNGIQSYVLNKENLAKTEKYFESKEHFLIGKGTDVLISCGKVEFDKLYHTSTLEEKPSETMMKVMHMALIDLQNEVEIFPLNYMDYGPVLHRALNNVDVKDSKTGEWKKGYWMARHDPDWRADTRLSKDLIGKKECVDYWKDIVLARGKQVLSVDEKGLIDTIVNNWLTHPNTTDLFTAKPNVIRVYQFPVYFMYNDVWCKGLIDRVDIDVELKTITIIDFKTMTGFTLNFPRVMRARRYDFQLAFYYAGLCRNLEVLSEYIALDVMDYVIQNPICVVESTNNPGMPLQFELSDSLLLLGQRGDDKLSGYEQMLEEYYYWSSQDFDIPTICQRAVVPGRLTVDSQFNFIKP